MLDQQRLGKQRVETLQVMQALTGRKLENTFHMEETGRYRKKWEYLSEEEHEAALEVDEDADDFRVTYEPILKRIDHPESEWYTIEYWPKGWTNHPVARMWKNHLGKLMEYQLAICREWAGVRGYRDTCLAKTQLIVADSSVVENGSPTWLGDEKFHLSHKQALIHKKPEFYQPIWPNLLPVYDYVWPAAS